MSDIGESEVAAAAPARTLRPDAARDRIGRWGKALLRREYIGVGFVLALMVVYWTATQDRFLTGQNVKNILNTNAVLLVLVAGQTVVMISRGIDLSVGSAFVLVGVVLAELLGRGMPEGLAIALALVFGAGLGLVNGLLIGWLKFDFFVVTLGTLALFRGLALVYTNGEAQSVSGHKVINFLGNGEILGISTPIVIAVAVVLAVGFVLRYTIFGRRVYLIGGNEEASRLTGIPIDRTRVMVYVISGALAGLAGVILTGRLLASDPVGESGTELTVIAAVLLGGISLAGGAGSIVGSVMGVLFIGVLANGLSIAGISAFWQQVVTGVILILAVSLDFVRRRTGAINTT